MSSPVDKLPAGPEAPAKAGAEAPTAAAEAAAKTAAPAVKKRGTRTGFTTGACAAASAKAATRLLVRAYVDGRLQADQRIDERQCIELLDGHLSIETTLPNRQKVTFALKRCELSGNQATCSIIKDAGDDPDCTHGAEIVATVELTDAPGIELRGGDGVAVVTKAGLGLEVGGPAINPVPRRNITEMVEEELAGTGRGAVVTIIVPGGVEMAKQTLNARLGLVGGISILGTTGIVKPYSTAAYKASVVQGIDVAKNRGIEELVLTTGGKSEAYAMKLHPHLPEEAFIQVGDFIGTGVKHCARRQVRRAIIVGMMGKLSKMANGKMQTHAAGSEVNMELLAELAEEAGATSMLIDEIRRANTARHVLELCHQHGLRHLTSLVCRRVAENCRHHAGGALEVHALLVDFNGELLGRFPSPTEGEPMQSKRSEGASS